LPHRLVVLLGDSWRWIGSAPHPHLAPRCLPNPDLQWKCTWRISAVGHKEPEQISNNSKPFLAGTSLRNRVQKTHEVDGIPPCNSPAASDGKSTRLILQGRSYVLGHAAQPNRISRRDADTRSTTPPLRPTIVHGAKCCCLLDRRPMPSSITKTVLLEVANRKPHPSAPHWN
jgi:hypothetical protein